MTRKRGNSHFASFPFSNEQSVKKMPHKRISGFDPFALYQSNPGFAPGEAELFIGGVTDQVIGRMAAFMLMTARTKEGKLPFLGLTIVAPPRLVWDCSDEDILELILDAVEDLRETPADANEGAIIKSLLSVVRCGSLDVADVLKAVKAASAKRLFLFPEAGKYRDSAISLDAPLGRTSVVIAENQWVPHVASLTSACIEVAKSTESFLVLDVTENPPARESNQKMLVDIEGLYPYYLGLEGKTDPSELILTNASKWATMASTGRANEALAELNAANLDSAYKGQLAIQIAYRSGGSELTARLIRDELAKGAEFPPEIAARFGRVAQRIGDADTAERLLNQSIGHIADQNLLESVLISCTALKNPELVQRAFERLAALFPKSELLRTNCEQRLMQFCQLVFGSSEEQLPSSIGFSEAEKYLADELSKQAQGNYEELLTTVGEKWPGELDVATICCAINAHTTGNSPTALALAISAAKSRRYEYQAVNIILAVMRRMMLLDEVSQEEIEIYKLPLLFVIRYLAKHPADAMTRVALTNVLAVESCGAVGLPLIASLTLDIAKDGANITPVKNSETSGVSEQTLRTFLNQALSWLGTLPALEVGVTRLPMDFTGDNPKGLITSLTKLIHCGANQREDNADLHFLEQCAYLVCLLTPYAPEENSDLDVLRMLADRCWFEGQSQKARDLAEQILELAGSSPKRQRAAWASFADVYHRTRSPIDALIGISCAFACETQVDSKDLWQETYTLLRIVRDLNLHKVAKILVSTCRKLLALQGMEKASSRRLDTIELGIRLSDLPNNDLVEFSALVADATDHCAEVIKDNEELLPATALLAQAVGLLERAGGQVESKTRKILEASLKGIGARTAEYIRVVSAATPSVEDVINIHARLDKARNSQDVPGNLVAVVMAARRLLQGCVAQPNPEEAVVAVELLAERALELPEGARELDEQWPAEYAKKLSSEGLAVLMLGLDEKGDLVSVLAKEGSLEIKRSAHQEGSFRQHLQKWSTEYPYNYGLIDRGKGNNEFYLTMQALDIPLPSFPNILVVAEPVLQQIPLNLLLDGGEFAGQTRSMGYAPSLTWFEAARRNPTNHDGRRLAWVSASEDNDRMRTLEIILERLRPTLDQHGFRTDTSHQIPKDFSGAQMAVVTAHGDLTIEKRFIHKISDEEALAASPVALAHSLADIELVILFVCSGGRIDRHPLGNTTVGLPKLLLGHGCRTVIASPWPLAEVVTGPWFEGFMKAWDAGETASTATFRANKAVEVRLGNPPQYVLAMTVYGDVLLRKR